MEMKILTILRRYNNDLRYIISKKTQNTPKPGERQREAERNKTLLSSNYEISKLFL